MRESAFLGRRHRAGKRVEEGGRAIWTCLVVVSVNAVEGR